MRSQTDGLRRKHRPARGISAGERFRKIIVNSEALNYSLTWGGAGGPRRIRPSSLYVLDRYGQGDGGRRIQWREAPERTADDHGELRALRPTFIESELFRRQRGFTGGAWGGDLRRFVSRWRQGTLLDEMREAAA